MELAILYEDEFSLPGGRASFAPLPYKPPGDAADDEFPLILVTGRRLEGRSVRALRWGGRRCWPRLPRWRAMIRCCWR